MGKCLWLKGEKVPEGNQLEEEMLGLCTETYEDLAECRGGVIKA